MNEITDPTILSMEVLKAILIAKAISLLACVAVVAVVAGICRIHDELEFRQIRREYRRMNTKGNQ